MTSTFIFYNISYDEVEKLTSPGKKISHGDMDWFIVSRASDPERSQEPVKNSWRVKMELEAL